MSSSPNPQSSPGLGSRQASARGEKAERSAYHRRVCRAVDDDPSPRRPASISTFHVPNLLDFFLYWPPTTPEPGPFAWRGNRALAIESAHLSTTRPRPGKEGPTAGVHPHFPLPDLLDFFLYWPATTDLAILFPIWINEVWGSCFLGC